MNWRLITSVVSVGAVIALVTYDVVTYAAGGPSTTISRVVLDFASQHPAVTFAAGFLMGHILWPQTKRVKRENIWWETER